MGDVSRVRGKIFLLSTLAKLRYEICETTQFTEFLFEILAFNETIKVK